MKNEYLNPLLNGVLFGIPFCIAAGPVFFALLYAAANKGIRLSLIFAFGVLIGDIVLILISYYFINLIQDFFLQYFSMIKITMFLFLFGVGIFTIFKKSEVTINPVPLKYNVAFLFFIYGFFLNVFNPSNVLIWAGVSSGLMHYDKTQHFLFYLASLLTIGFLMFILVYLSKKIVPMIGNGFLEKFNFFSGLLFLLCSFILLYYLAPK